MMKAIIYTATNSITNKNKLLLAIDPMYSIIGCTGLWQVSARNEVGFYEMVELDLQYIKKSGLLYDLAIILKTIKIMIVSNGAY